MVQIKILIIYLKKTFFVLTYKVNIYNQYKNIIKYYNKMFYIYQYDDIENEETKKLIYNITLNKQKTIIILSQNIRMSILSKDKRVVWLDDENIIKYKDLYNDFINIRRIKMFKKLDEITVSIYDEEWIWNDEYICEIFNGLV